MQFADCQTAMSLDIRSIALPFLGRRSWRGKKSRRRLRLDDQRTFSNHSCKAVQHSCEYELVLHHVFSHFRALHDRKTDLNMADDAVTQAKVSVRGRVQHRSGQFYNVLGIGDEEKTVDESGCSTALDSVETVLRRLVMRHKQVR
jgi:hypothetical protein